MPRWYRVHARAYLFESQTRDGALHDDLHTGRGVARKVELIVGVLGDVGLAQHDDGTRAALPRQHELALEAAHVEALARKRLHDEDHVDVGDEHLLVGLLTGVLARKRARAGQDRLDDGEVVALGSRDRDPVAHDRTAPLAVGLYQVRRRFDADLSRLGGDHGHASVDARQPPGCHSGVGERLEERALAVGPAEFDQGEALGVVCVSHGN